MNANKARKRVIFLSVSSILAGGVFLSLTAIFYFKIQNWLINIVNQKPSPEVVACLVNVIKSLIFHVIPSLSIILITIGVSMLFNLRAWRKAND
ncbi:MAG: hypothetical protein WCS94_07245 [Verrucomicrobiota bacterium]